MKKFFSFISMLFFFGNTFSQFFENSILKDTNQLQNHAVYLTIDNSTFFKNNEYFGNIEEGYTLPGFWIQPKLTYKISDKTCITGGGHFLKFYGKENFTETEPYLSVNQKITDNLSFTLGSLETKYGHFLPNPLYDPERFYFNQVENGLQFRYSSNLINSDTWLSWDKFIYYGDSIQEQLTAGSSNSFDLLKSDQWSVRLPLYVIFTHKGGQINRPKKAIETIVNLGSGMKISYFPSSSILKTIELNPEIYFYNKNTSAEILAYDTIKLPHKGWALYPSITLFLNNFYFKGSYWYSHQFYAPRGEIIYRNISNYKTYKANARTMYVGKIGYFKNLKNGITVSTGFEGFFDPDQKLFDYNYFVHFNFSGFWLLKKSTS